MFSENTEYEILTPTGWCDFRGVSFAGKKQVFRINLNSGRYVEATAGHFFFVDDKKIPVSELRVGIKIKTNSGNDEIVSIIDVGIREVYDIIEVSDPNHQFLVNDGLISKNCDELSAVKTTITDGFWTSIAPTISTGGKAIITSTPNSDEDLFATIWKEANDRFDETGNSTELGKNGFFPYFCHWSENPTRDQAWADHERSKIGHEMFEREYECRFIIADETLISPTKLSELTGVNPKHHQGLVRWYRDIDPSKTYLVALDPSMGTGGDEAAIQVFTLPDLEQVGEWMNNTTPVREQAKLLREVCRYIAQVCEQSGMVPSIYYTVENNSLAEALLNCIEDLGEESIPGLFMSEPIKKGVTRRYRRGFTTSHPTKIESCSRLKHLIENDLLKIKSKPLISELKTFIARGASYGGKGTYSDNLVSATLLIVRMIYFLKEWDPFLFDQIQKLAAPDEEILLPMPIYISGTF